MSKVFGERKSDKMLAVHAAADGRCPNRVKVGRVNHLFLLPLLPHLGLVALAIIKSTFLARRRTGLFFANILYYYLDVRCWQRRHGKSSSLSRRHSLLKRKEERCQKCRGKKKRNGNEQKGRQRENVLLPMYTFSVVAPDWNVSKTR